MKNRLLIAVILTIFLGVTVSAIANPAAVYCEEMGYEFRIDKTAQGEQGICVVEDKYEFDAWDFFKGKVGQEYSYCTERGYLTEVRKDGKNPYSKEYAVCVPSKSFLRMFSNNQEEVSMSDLIGLQERLGDDEREEFEFPEAEKAGSSRSVKSSDATDLPAYFDWRDKDGEDWMTSVKSQGTSCNSCIVFSSTGVVEAQVNIDSNNPNKDLDLSEQQPICRDVISCEDGGWISAVLNFIRDFGITSEDDLPYTGDYTPCNLTTSSEGLTFIEEWDIIEDSPWLSYNHEEQEAIVKQALIKKGPLATKIYMSGEFDDDQIYRCDSLSKKHAGIIVGYSDTGDVHTSYWIVKNSWGNTWNADGYFKVGWDGYYEGFEMSHCAILGSAPVYAKSGAEEQTCELPVSADLLGHYHYNAGGKDVAVLRDYAYLGGDCLDSIDISDKANPKQADSMCFGGYNQRTYHVTLIDENSLYVSTEAYGFKIINISDPHNLEVIGEFDNNPNKSINLGDTNGIFVKDDYAYVASRNDGLKIVDISNLDEINEVGRFSDEGYAEAVDVVGDHAYVADGWRGLDIIDVSDKTNPTKVGELDLIGDAMDIEIKGNYAYIAEWGEGLNIIDVSNSENPVSVAEISTGGFTNEGFAGSLDISGDYLYLTAWKQGLFIIDISNPENPVEIFQYYNSGSYNGVYVDDEYVYIAKDNYTYDRVNGWGTQGKGLDIIKINFDSCSPEPVSLSLPASYFSEPAGALQPALVQEKTRSKKSKSKKTLTSFSSFDAEVEENINELQIICLSKSNSEREITNFERLINFLKSLIKLS